MKNPVIDVGALIKHIKSKSFTIEQELDSLVLTENELSDKIKEAKKLNIRDDIISYANEVVEVKLKCQYLKGRLEELKDLSNDLINSVGKSIIGE